MTCTVIVLPEAKDDLLDIYLYVAEHGSVSHADALLEKLEHACSSLNLNPERGHTVPELKRVHIGGFREIHYKPFRIIFQKVVDTVYVHAVLDGRRELQELLERRMLRQLFLF